MFGEDESWSREGHVLNPCTDHLLYQNLYSRLDHLAVVEKCTTFHYHGMKGAQYLMQF